MTKDKSRSQPGAPEAPALYAACPPERVQTQRKPLILQKAALNAQIGFEVGIMSEALGVK